MTYEGPGKIYDLAIIGAGPAGISCALALKGSGLRMALFDKSTFPRNKICGDAIPGRAIRVLKEIIPGFQDRFRDFRELQAIEESFFYYGSKRFHHSWTLEAYTCRRMEFDNFLLSLLKEQNTAEIYEGAKIRDVSHEGNRWQLGTAEGRKFSARMIVGADGVNGVTAKLQGGRRTDRDQHVTAVRAYYKGIRDVNATSTEFYIDKKYIPGYFWIFPLAGGFYNAGFGMLSGMIAKKNINLRQAFGDFISRSEILRYRFGNAEPAGPLEAYGIPLGPGQRVKSGDGLLLTGDAASLVDPLSGDGIGNAVLSGSLAARQVRRCFEAGDFSQLFMKQYDSDISRELGQELRQNSFMQKMASGMPWLPQIVFTAGKRVKY